MDEDDIEIDLGFGARPAKLDGDALEACSTPWLYFERSLAIAIARAIARSRHHVLTLLTCGLKTRTRASQRRTS